MKKRQRKKRIKKDFYALIKHLHSFDWVGDVEAVKKIGIIINQQPETKEIDK